MGDKSGIEWTDATWNPVAGCDRISPGCDNCYAIGQAHRMSANPTPGIQMVYLGTTRNTGSRVDWTGYVNTIDERLDQPIRWTRPRRIFVNSMSDLFHEAVPDEFIAEVFAVMAQAGWHTFQVLTKRHERMRLLVGSEMFREMVYNVDQQYFPWPLPNVWLGVSVESHRYSFRARALAETPAAVRWLSVEPLIGPPGTLPLDGIDWVVAGGESGQAARPMHPEWARSVRDQATAAGVRFHFKQWGSWAEALSTRDGGILLDMEGNRRSTNELDRLSVPSGWARMAKVGKRVAGRELDGRTWDQYPEEADDDRRR